MQRETLGSRLGFILLSAGCAIGIGNVWKFPWMVGEYGGAIFVLIYLFFLLIMGVPIMTMEFSIGRASRRSPAKMYREIEPKGSRWHIHSYFAVAGNYLLMMFYTTVCGWMLYYFVETAKGSLSGLDTTQVASVFKNLTGDWKTMTIYMVIVVIVGFFVSSVGLQKGIERITKYMMLALLGIMIFLAGNSIFLEGGLEGLKFYLLPNVENIKEAGLMNVIVAAMNQSFFTLSIGMGSMAIFGSYIGKDRALMGEAVNIAVLDTFVAFTAGLIIFPACFAFGVEPNSGPDLIFITLPNVFNQMPPVAGRIIGAFFFVFMSFAAISTVFAVFENIIACTCDLLGWSRKKASLINCAMMIILSLPCVLGFNILSGFNTIGAGKNIMDLEDFLVSNCILPLGSLIFVLFCTLRYGWGWKNFTDEANTGKGLKVKNWMRGYCTYVLPVIIVFLFSYGIYSIFFAK